MKYINVIDAKEQFSYLVNLLCDPKEEVYLTFGGKPIIKMTPITENLPCVKERYRTAIVIGFIFVRRHVRSQGYLS